jgi:putative peptide zinc metalloprotease protein
VAFALVWIDDDSPALNKNEAYAFASCTSCGAVAVGFQVVLVTGENHVAAPQNLSGALNSDCVNCLTYALATQLFVTLDGPLKEPGMQALTALWAQIADFGAHITEVPLSEIQDRLTAYEKQILEIIAQDQGPLTSTSPGPGTPTATDDASGAPTPGATASTDPTSSASPGSTATGSSDGATPTASPTGGSTTSAPDGPATSAAAGTSGPTPTTDPSADPTSVSTP